MRRGIFIVLLVLLALPAAAHEMRPAYLALHEETPGTFHVLWKTPMRGDLRLALTPEFSGATEILTPMIMRRHGGAAVQTWRIRAVDPLRGHSIRIRGLESTMTDALVRMEFVDGMTWTQRLTPRQPETVIPPRQSGSAVALVYTKLGMEHILLGVDHLLFVLGLLLITMQDPRYEIRDKGHISRISHPGSRISHHTSHISYLFPLIKTITAFTIAHSITLVLATLGFLRVSQAPVEAVIALSIVFVATEILRMRHGELGLTARAPWVVAFAFGLLHGLGFAGALNEVGLPQGQIPVALLFFNLGVEAGQLLFIGLVLTVMALVWRLRMSPPRWAEVVPAYAIGSVAMFWVFQRMAAF